MKSRTRFTLGAVSGLAMWAGFAPFEMWVLPILGAAGLFIALGNAVLMVRIATAFVSGMFFFLPLLHWSSTYVGSAPWFILAFGESLIFSAIGFVNLRRNIAGAAVFASAFTLLELMRMKFPFGGFGWGRLGFTQVDSLAILYPLVGVTGITILIASLSALITLKRRTSIISILIFAGLFVLNVNSIIPSGSKSKFNLVAVQGGVGELGLDYNSRALDVLNRHVAASADTSASKLVIWPENAIDIDPSRNAKAKEILLKFLENQNGFLMAGVVESSDTGPKNSSIIYDNNGEEFSRYVKQDLAPFGEYMPLRGIAERISPFAQQVNDFVPGNKWSPVSIAGWSFQSFICFEILDDDHVKDGSKTMDFLVAQTNNATFGKSPQANQQLQIIKARAAELRKEFAVVSTTGFTAHLDQRGQIVESLPQFEPGTLKMAINRSNGDTPASHLSTLNWVVFCVVVAFLGIRRYSR